MKLYLVRHAQSMRNAKQNSEVDTSLTETGIEQAKRLGSWFRKVKVDRIYCSNLKRAKDTLEKMKVYLKDVPVTYTSELNEMNFGIYQENGFDDLGGFFRDAWTKFGEKYFDFKPKNGESLKDLNKRAFKFYKKLLKKHKDDNIIIVGHGFFLAQFVIGILGLNVIDSKYFELPNASVSQFFIEEGKLTNFHVGDFHHLLVEGMNKDKRPKVLLKRK